MSKSKRQIKKLNTKTRRNPLRSRDIECLEDKRLLAVDAFEPNNFVSQASNLGSANQTIGSLSIDPVADVDWYRWTAPQAGTLRVDALFTHSQGDLDLLLYRSSNTVIPVDASVTLTDNERVSIDVAQNEEVYFRVKEFTGFLNTNYSLNIQLILPDVAESPTRNDTLGTAYNLGSVASTTISNLNIDKFTDKDYFRWTSPVTGELNVDATFLHSNGNLDMSVLDNNGTTIASSSSLTNNEEITINVTQGQQYFIKVEDANNQEHPNYSLSLSTTAPPAISDIPLVLGYVSGTTFVDFTVSDSDTPLSQLTLSATSSDNFLLPSANFVFSGTGANRTLEMTSPGGFGFVDVTITVTDPQGNQDSEEFPVAVFLTNGLPTISSISDIEIPESTSSTNIGFTVSDGETPSSELIVTATSSNTALIPNENITLGGLAGNRTIRVTPVPNGIGTSTISVTVKDENGGMSSEIFVVTVVPVNDAPIIAPIDDQIITEDAPKTIPVIVDDEDSPLNSLTLTASSNNQALIPNGNIVLNGSGANRTVTLLSAPNQSGGPVEITLTVSDGTLSTNRVFNVDILPANDPPTISSIANQNTFEDMTIPPISFTIGDIDTPLSSLSLSATSTNISLIPPGNITFGGSGANRTISLTPALSQSGASTITVTVNDGAGGVATESFVVTVEGDNDAPIVSTIANQTIFADTTNNAVAFTVSDDMTQPSLLFISAFSSNQDIIPDANLTLQGTGNDRSLLITPAAGQIGGPVVISILVSDGINNTLRTFQVNVVAGAPTISPIADQTLTEDTPTSAIPFTIGDANTPIGDLTLTVTSGNTTILPQAGIVVGGTGANRTLTLTPAANQHGGPFDVTVTLSDGVDTTTEVFAVTVTSVNDLPVISPIADQTIAEDGSTGAIAFTITDVETASSALNITATSNDVTLIPVSGIVLGGSGANRTITVTPAAQRSGSATITVTASDGNGGTSIETFVVTVTEVADVPTISAIADVTVNEDQPTAAIPFTIGDDDTPLANLTLTATSSNTSVVAPAGIVLGGSGANRTIKVTPVANASGASTISVTVSDGTNSVTEQFVVTVSAVNDLPTISTIADVTVNEDNPTAAIPFTISDVETPVGNLTLSVTSDNQALIPNGNLVIAGTRPNLTLTATPLANQNGTATITLQIADGNGGQTAEAFLLTVNAVDDAPTITPIQDVDSPEDEVVGPIAFTVTDIDTPLENLVLSATSDNLGLFTVANIEFGGSGQSRTVQLTPEANAFGNASIVVTVSDGTTDVVESFAVSVDPINDAPGVSAIADQTIPEDSSTGALAFTISDVESNVSQLTVSAASSNATLIPVSGIVLGGSGANRTINITPASNQVGTAVVSVTVSDPNGGVTVESFQVNVQGVGDPPTISSIADVTSPEDTVIGPIAFTVGDIDTPAEQLVVTVASSNEAVIPASGIVISGTGADRSITLTPASNVSGSTTITLTVTDDANKTSQTSFDVTVEAVNDLPTVSAIADQTTDEETSVGPIAFTIGDVETAVGNLTITKASSNTTLVPAANIVLGGSGANRTVTVTPAANQTGQATISITVADGNGGATTEQFVLTVGNVNDAPTISAISDLTINEDAASSAISFTVADTDTPLTNLTVTGSSSNAAVVANSGIAIGGAGANRTVTITPVANANGSADITLTVSDGSLSATETFTVTVTAVNDIPTISAIADQQTADGTATSPISFTIGDLESAASSLTVTAVSDNQALVSNANLVLSGSNANRQLVATPIAGQTGSATITVTVADGNGGSASETFVLTVTPAQIPPTISAIADITLAEDTSSSAIAFTIGDTDTPIGNLSVSATSDNQGVIPAGSIQIGGTGASRTITVTPAADAVGQATITVTVSDGSTTASETFKVTVTPVEDAPTISALSNRTIDEDTVLGPIAVTIGDAETPADQLVLTVSSSNQDVAPSSGITIGGTGAERTLTIVPASNESGSSNITLTVEDQNGQTATRTFTLNVTAVNDRPSITGVANQVLTEDTPSNPILFSVGDAETQASNLTVTASSSDMTLLPPSGLVLSGTGSERTLVITPGANQTGGPAVVTLTVSDGLSTSSRTFEVSVTPVNDAPSISAIANQTGVEDTTLGPIPFTVSDVDSPIGNVVLAASSNNLALVPNSSIVIGGTGENRTLTISPAPNGTGSAVITLTATDGQATSERNFTVSFNPVSDAPVIADIADQTINEDTSSGDITVGLSDADTDVNALTLTATSSNQSVIANGDIVISGSGAKRTIVVTPVANAFGSAVISVTASDGQSSTTETFTVNVVNINDPPSISAIANQTIGKNATWTVPVMVSDIETASGALLVTATSSNQNVIPASNLTLSGTGANRTLQIVSGESVGQSDITVTVSDGTASTATTFTVTVQNAGDTTPPVVTNFVRNDGNDRFNTLTSVSITFSEDVSGSLAASDLVITPAGGGAAVDTSSATVAWDANTRTARWNLSGINFPTGFYNVTLPSGAIADGAGNVLDGDGSGNAGGAYSQQVLVALIGDSNLDGIFNTSDLVTIFQIGEYEDTVAGNSTWIEGDWNGDGDFNTSDLVFAFQANTYTAAAVSDVAPDAATTVSVGTDIRQAVLFDQSLELNQRAKSTDDFWANDDAEDVVTDQIWM